MKKRLLALTLLLAMLVSVLACTKTEENSNDTQQTATVDTSDGYDYGELDCQGEDFTFLQCDEGRWNMKTALAPEKIVGEEVSDAVYARNTIINELYNVNIKCENVDIYETGNYIRIQTTSGDTTADVAFVIGESVPTLITEGCLSDIAAIPNIQIYEPWWNQKIREDSQFVGSSSLYFAQTDISLLAFELTWCVAVNLDMVSELQLENPYDLVKNGQWTMEKMFQMAKVGMVPNADGTYDYNEDTDCVLGIATYDNFASAAINGAGCLLTEKDALGLPTFAGEGERFLDVIEQWSEVFLTPGMAVNANDDGFHYEEIFGDSRSLFVGTEIKGTTLYRTKGLHYGILPVPKYNAEQDGYNSTVNYIAPVLVIPKTNAEAEKTGRILDTMAYLSYKDVLPVYYDSSLSYKSLNDSESIEMLNIIRDSRVFETSLLFGWTVDYYLDIRNVFIGKTSAMETSGIIASHRSSIKKAIDGYFAEVQ